VRGAHLFRAQRHKQCPKNEIKHNNAVVSRYVNACQEKDGGSLSVSSMLHVKPNNVFTLKFIL
jgi:hypothetical protein